ncbi:MAG: DMT family transporter [Bacteroidetes bacterium]|nr:DMT family transporter [Bacteroidota bacterium]MBP6648887.1 DMT family transporter [Bacteroidia bacterium]MBK6838550.1 DMT family transporter [Bacteroidota bacterium]MBK9524821.1 DMT family transporter [Bacteroidota bacterium]MBK9542987.1 DMT family transporter [Bacteroidota bacterium]
MHSAIFLWGFTGLLGKLISLNEGLLVWYRLFISSLAIAIMLLVSKKIPSLKWKEVLRIGGIGFIVMLHWVTFYGSIKLSSISVAMICLSSIALFASIIEPLVNKTRFDYVDIVFSLFALAGIATIYHSDLSASAGIIVGVTSALLSAIFSTLNKRIAGNYEALTISLVELSSGLLLLTVLMPFYLAIQPATHYLPDFSDSIYLLILSLVCTVLTWILSLDALRKVSAFTMGLALNLEPVYGIILAVLFAGEGKILNEGFYYGALIIMITVVLHTVYKFRKAVKIRKSKT